MEWARFKKTRLSKLLTSSFLLLTLFLAVFLGGAGDFSRPSKFEKVNELNRPDCRLGVFVGTGSEQLARNLFPDAKIIVFDDAVEAGTSLLGGHLEGFIGAEHVLNVFCRAYPLRLRMMDEPLEQHPYHVMLKAGDDKMLKDVNAFIAKYRKNGTYDDMFLRWCLADKYVPIPEIPEPCGSNGTLRVGTSGLVEPSSFLDDDGNLTGYDIEFALRLGRALDRKVTFLLKPDTDFLGELREGQVDVVINNCNDPDCPKGFVHSDGYLDSDKKVLLAEAQPGLDKRLDALMLEGTRFGVADALIKDPRARLFVNGFINTFAITLLSALFGFALARGVRSVERRLPKAGCYAIDYLMNGIKWTPPLLLLLLFHGAILYWASPWMTAVVAFGVWFAAYLEPVAGGDPLGWLPVVRLRLPVLLQWTSVVGYISVFDLTMAVDLVCGRSMKAAVPLLSVAAAYGLIAWLIDYGVAWIEGKMKE